MTRMLNVLPGAVVAVASLWAWAGSAQAATYVFEGNCEDCATAAGTATFPVTGLLELLGAPVQSGAVDMANFSLWTYSGSNLLDPYVVLPGDVTRPEPPVVSHTVFAASGMIEGGTVKTLDLRFGDGLEFILKASGEWSTCGVKDGKYYAVPCSWATPNDFGVGEFSIPAIPEPKTFALLALGLGALVWRHHGRVNRRT